MRSRPNPYRVLAHALDSGDARLAELLATRLLGIARRPRGIGAARAIERLVQALRVD
jgi:hypothetical protein